MPDNRNYSEKINFSVSFKQTVNGLPDASFLTGRDVSFSSSFSGQKSLNWRELVLRGENATTIASGSRTTIMSSGTSLLTLEYYSQAVNQRVLKQVVGNPLMATDSYGIVPPAPDSSMVQEVDNRVLAGFLKRAKDKQIHFNGGVFLGELRETLRLLRRPAAGLRDLVSSYVNNCRRDLRRVREELLIRRRLSSLWLEFQFGARPFISDIESASAALALLRDKRGLVPVRYQFTNEKLVDINVINTAVYDIPFQVQVTRKNTYTRRIIGAVACETLGGPLIRERFFGHIQDFVPTVYELIPYSFLVDYFTNIGEMIECWSFCQSDLAWFCSTHRSEQIASGQMYGRPVTTLFGLPVTMYSCTPISTDYRVTAFSRNALPLGLPSFRFKLPGTSTKFLNIAALASMRIL